MKAGRTSIAIKALALGALLLGSSAWAGGNISVATSGSSITFSAAASGPIRAMRVNVTGPGGEQFSQSVERGTLTYRAKFIQPGAVYRYHAYVVTGTEKKPRLAAQRMGTLVVNQSGVLAPPEPENERR